MNIDFEEILPEDQVHIEGSDWISENLCDYPDHKIVHNTSLFMIMGSCLFVLFYAGAISILNFFHIKLRTI